MYKRQGLLVADRSPSNRRMYTDEHVAQYHELAKTNATLLTRRKHFKHKDLTGEVFGKLTVIRRADDFISANGHRHIQWLCECVCGEQRVIKGASLSAGYNKSCGCSQYGDGDTKRMWQEYTELLSNQKSNSVDEQPKPVGRKRKDSSGQTFGWLTALHHGEDVVFKSGKTETTWHCKCRCDNTLDVITSRLSRGEVVSCGCMPMGMRKDFRHKINSQRKPTASTSRLDLTNQTFGFWTVLEQSETKVFPSGGRATQWLCECACGNQKVVPTRDLRSGASQSCGCMTSTSWLEYYVLGYLRGFDIPYEHQKKYDDLIGTGGKQLSYDFLIYDKDNEPLMLIECQGEQHFRPIRRFGGAKKLLEQQIHDKLKRNYAVDVVGIPLNEILYTCMTEDDVRSKLQSFGL